MSTAPDLTLLRDPAQVWPDPMTCPDWPLASGGDMLMGAARKTSAEASERLALLAQEINRPGDHHAPKPAEIARIEAEYFRTVASGEGGGVVERFARLGFAGLRPKTGGTVGAVARQMAEAVHIRGYLRKLSHEVETAQETEAETFHRQHQRQIDGFKAALAEAGPELDRLAEAEERHLQRVADERAYRRGVELRRMVRIRHGQAVDAARALGVAAPDLPDMRADDWTGSTAI